MINSKVILIYRRLTGLFAITVVCFLLLTTGPASTRFVEASVGISADPNSHISSRPAADANDANGPTVQLSYNNQKVKKNPAASFMYFVPLISPTLVDLETDVDNEQKIQLVSYERNVTSKSFYVSCEFEMAGKGFYTNTFDAAQVIEIICFEGQNPDEPMTNALDYIKFEGEGFGQLEVRGTRTGSIDTVTEVEVHFNARGLKSPVIIGLYDVIPKDGQFKYENKYNEKIARVASLTFKKCEGEPRMGIKVVSVNKATNPDSYVGKIKGTIANFFLNPPRVSKVGNDTMLKFGLALLKKQPSFTFPKATNIKETRTVTIDNNSKPLAGSGYIQK